MGDPQFAALVRIPDITLGGSTGAYVVEYNGARFVYKTGATARHAVNEYLAFQMYERVGAKVPHSFLVYDGENPVGCMLEYIEGQTPATIMSEGKSIKEIRMLKQAISKDYILHALFANYDCNNGENYIVPKFAAGTEEMFENSNNDYDENNTHVITHTTTNDYGNTYIIDLGGALFYRAQGVEKERLETKSVPELNNIAMQSITSRNQLFFELATSPYYKKHRILSERWRTIDASVLPMWLQTPPIQSLLVQFEMTALTKIIKGRIEAIHAYCTGTPLGAARTEDEFLVLADDIRRDILAYKGPADLERIKAKLVGQMEVFWYESEHKLLLIHAYDTNRVLFQKLLDLAGGAALHARTDRNLTLLHYVIEKEDYDTMIALIVRHAQMSIEEMNRVDIARILDGVGRIAPKHRLFGRVHAPEFTPFSSIFRNQNYNLIIRETTRGSLLDKQLLLKKPINGHTKWHVAQETYLNSSPRIRAIVRAYTFRGDKLANSYLRGTLTKPYDILNQIRGDTVIPFAYQIYDKYEFLVGNGLTMPPKDTLMMGDGVTIHDANIHALYLANFDYFLRLPTLHTLMKAYCRDLLAIIQKAPRAPDNMFVYRGIQNEDHLKPGTYEYVNKSFISTSLDPYIACNSAFTKQYLIMPMRYCIYEMELPYGAPCIALNSVSHFSEDEILLPYNLTYTHSVDITLKYKYNCKDEFSMDTDPTLMERIFVRDVRIGGFSGYAEPKTFAVDTRRKKQTKYKYSDVNNVRRETVRNRRINVDRKTARNRKTGRNRQTARNRKMAAASATNDANATNNTNAENNTNSAENVVSATNAANNGNAAANDV